MSKKFEVNTKKVMNNVENFLHLKRETETIYNLFKRALVNLNDKIRKTSLGMLSYMDDSKLIFGFEKFCKRRNMPLNFKYSMEQSDLYEFIEFSLSFATIYNSSDQLTKRKLLGSLKRGLDQGKLLSFQHEIQTYVHLTHSGFTVKYEDGSNNKNYEFSAEKAGHIFAVECKTISRYAGAPVIESAAHEFFKKIDWDKVNAKINKLSIVCFSFDGKLTMNGFSYKNESSPDSLLQEFYHKLDLNHPDIIIKELENRPTYNFTWLRKKFSEISDDFPLSHILFNPPNNFERYLPSSFIVLNSKSPSEYINEINKQIDKALKQTEGNLPAVIFIQLEGLTKSLLPEVRVSLESIIANKISCINQPVMCCVRTELDYDKNESCYRAQMLVLKNQNFTPYLECFRNSILT